MSAAAYSWRCACCGNEFTGLPMDLFFEEPFDWQSLDGETRRRSFLDEDFCEVRYGDGTVDRFIRCLLHLPVPELGEDFRFGVWMSVSERSWGIYLDGFGKGSYETGGCFGYLMHEIPDYPGSSGLHANVCFRPDDLRPIVELQDADHPLVAAQREGIDIAQVTRWAAMTHAA